MAKPKKGSDGAPAVNVEAFATEQVALASLKPHPRNYRSHSADQLAHIKASIEEHGFYRNVVVAKDSTILAGHGVVQAASEMGLVEIPVVRVDVDPESTQALKILTGDNEISRGAGIDDRALTDMLKAIKDSDSLLGTGFDEKMLAALAMVTRAPSEIADFDAAAEWVGMPEYSTGQHRYCLVVAFSDAQARDAFMKEKALDGGLVTRGGAYTWSMSWPLETKKADMASLRFEPETEKAEAK